MPISRDGKFAMDDAFLKGRIKQIVREKKIKVIVETGLNEGNSTVEFAKIADTVIGIDIDMECLASTKEKLEKAGLANYTLCLGNSPDVLKEVAPNLPEETIFFLDAHWGEPWPLPEELKSLPKGKGILIFHDIKVPGQDFGFDGVMYEGKVHDFTYDLIKPLLDAWSPNHAVEYMTVASGSYRGAAIIYP